jgi:hypothetical protein
MLVLMIPGHAGIRPTFFDSFLLKGSLRDKDYPKDVVVVVVLLGVYPRPLLFSSLGLLNRALTYPAFFQGYFDAGGGRGITAFGSASFVLIVSIPRSLWFYDIAYSSAMKTYQCHRCERAFARLEHLKRHDRSREDNSCILKH